MTRFQMLDKSPPSWQPSCTREMRIRSMWFALIPRGTTGRWELNRGVWLPIRHSWWQGDKFYHQFLGTTSQQVHVMDRFKFWITRHSWRHSCTREVELEWMCALPANFTSTSSTPMLFGINIRLIRAARKHISMRHGSIELQILLPTKRLNYFDSSPEITDRQTSAK